MRRVLCVAILLLVIKESSLPGTEVTQPGHFSKDKDLTTLSPVLAKRFKPVLDNLVPAKDLEKLTNHAPAVPQQPQAPTPTPEQTARRTQALTKMFIMVMDEKVALTAAQREQLQPLAEKEIQGFVTNYADITKNTPGCSENDFFTAAQHATDSELKAILDPTQVARWRKLAQNSPSTPLAKSKLEPGEAPPPEHVEEAISQALYSREKLARQILFEGSSIRAEGVVRETGLREDLAVKLKLAALGTAAGQLSSWKSVVEVNARGQLYSIDPVNIDERLENISENLGRIDSPTEPDPAWDAIVKGELTPDQMVVWQKETEARATFRQQALAALVLSNLDHLVSLSTKQMEELRPLLEETIRDNDSAISQLFGSFNLDSTRWYFLDYYNCLPLAGVPDEKLRAILTQDQLSTWSGRPENLIGTNLWSAVTNMRGAVIGKQLKKK